MDKEIRNSFEQEMIDNGYRIFKSNFKSAIRGFQKRFDDKKGQKYFITIWHYNLAEQLQRDDVPKRDSYTADTQFRFEKDGKDETCNVEFWGNSATLKDIEIFFESFWKKMKPDYYERYE